MSQAYVLFMDGLDLDFIPSKETIDLIASQVINKTVDRARKSSADKMRDQVRFPASYLQGESSRLQVTQRASPNKLEAVITGRSRATSLARFASSAKKSRTGVMVEVKPGSPHLIPGTFLMPLKSGAEAGGNMGLAIRVKQGQRPKNAYRPVKINDRLWLLYGPSVNQVFKTVREDVSPEAAMFMQQEFKRLISREMQ